jgi:hypothetical protein
MKLEINESLAKRIFPEAPKWLKELLIENFGQKHFTKHDFRDIRTFKDACEEIGIDGGTVLHNEDTEDEIAYKMLKVIVKAINQGWSPDWTNGNQQKWHPWFMLSSGFGFVGSYCYSVVANASVGSRLCFETKEKSDYCAKQFIDLYEKFLTIKK